MTTAAKLTQDLKPELQVFLRRAVDSMDGSTLEALEQAFSGMSDYQMNQIGDPRGQKTRRELLNYYRERRKFHNAAILYLEHLFKLDNR